jgi:enamine deaminase RidA (YjgF/YER057c/UK114 family)
MYKTLFFRGIRIETCCFETGKGISEYHATLHVTMTAAPFAEQLSGLLDASVYLSGQYGKNVRPVFKRYFLSDAANQLPLLTEENNAPYAVSIVQQPPLDGSKIALWIYLKSDITTTVVPHGVLEEHNGYRHLWIAGLHVAEKDAYDQTESLFRTYAAVLEQKLFCLENDCIRTWLFVQNIDFQYAGVVKARKKFFEQHRLTAQTHYIVSTGIEGRHASSESLVLLDAYAVKGLQAGQLKYLYAPTHFNPTHEYGVTFERGVCVTYGDRNHILVAGTASINNKGEIVYPGNVAAQTHRVLENIEALLMEAGAGFEHIVQMIVYLRDMSDYPVVNAIMENRFDGLPKITVLAPVCRPGWLIEAECIAIREQYLPSFEAL